MKPRTIITAILGLVAALLLNGCVGFSGVVKELKNDPAAVDLEFQGWGASIKLRRSFPTNWPAK